MSHSLDWKGECKPYKVTMTLGEFRAATRDLPDDAEIFVDEGDLAFYEVRLHDILPPVTAFEHPAAIWLEMGQAWNEERDMFARVDARHGR